MNHDFEMDRRPEAPEGQPADPAAPPVVLVQYRDRQGLRSLLLPCAILTAAIVLAYSIRTNGIRRPDLAVRPGPVVESVRDLAAPPPITAPAPTPIQVVETRPADPPPTPVVPPVDVANTPATADPAPMPAPEPAVVADLNPPLLAPGPEPAPTPDPEPIVEVAVVAPVAEVPATKEEVWDAIDREARAKHAEIQAAADRQQQGVKVDREEARLKAVEQGRVLRELIELERQAFRAKLQQLVASQGDRAGPAIRALADQVHREIPPEIHQAVDRELKRWAGKLNRRAELEMMRSLGLPENELLADLVLVERKNRVARSGPRSENEVWLRAARWLLAYPPSNRRAVPASTTTPTRPNSPRGRP